jgi:organic hydroperoxide reductase OsmC/OhrA
MLKTHIDKARVLVTARFKNEGSVLKETVRAEGLGIETRCEITSTEPAEKIAKVLRNAEAGCYVIQTIRNPTEVKSAYTLNGATFEPYSYNKPVQ